MLKKILLLFTLLSILYSFSQTNISNINERKKIELLNRRVDSLVDHQNVIKSKILEERIAQATETIANQNSTISSFSYIYAAISLILGLIGITLPFITYFFGIKPSKDALKEFEEKSNAKFNNFLVERARNEIDIAIEKLKSDDEHTKNNSLNFLLYNSYQGFSEIQISRIINIINNSNDDFFSQQLINCIINEKNEGLKEYFIELLKTYKEVSNTLYLCLKFLSYYNYNDYKQALRIYISNNNNGNCITFILSIYPKNHILCLLNDKDIIDFLSLETLKTIKDCSFGKIYLSQWNMSEDDYKNTYLYEKLKSSFSVPD